MSDIINTAKRELAEHTLDPDDPCPCEWCDAMRYILSTAEIAKTGELVTSLYRKVYDEPERCGWPPQAVAFVKFDPHMPPCRVTVSRPYTEEQTEKHEATIAELRAQIAATAEVVRCATAQEKADRACEGVPMESVADILRPEWRGFLESTSATTNAVRARAAGETITPEAWDAHRDGLKDWKLGPD